MENDILRLAIQRKMTSVRHLDLGLIEVSVNAIDQLTLQPTVLYSSVYPSPEEIRKQAASMAAEESSILEAHRARVSARMELADLVEGALKEANNG